jgi:polysaccharide biosynthesis/export protein
MTSADLAITSNAGGSIKDGGALAADGYPVPVPVPVTSSTADYRPGAAITAERVAWAPTILPGDGIGPQIGADPDGPYRLDTGDRLRIFVYGQPNLSRLYVVDQAGKIAVPLIGNVRARGKTTNQLQAAIRSQLGAEYVKDPQVTVDIVQNRPFFILGEVKAGGQFPYVSGMTVETAVAIAGGYTERASERTFRITRRVNGFVEQIEAPSDYALMPGDTVYVFERFF